MRKAPLVNIGLTLLAVGEAIGRYSVGDFEGANSSTVAAVFNGLLSGSYVFGATTGNHNETNSFGAALNGIVSLVAYAGSTGETQSKSFSGSIMPYALTAATGLNIAEYGLSNRKKVEIKTR